MEESASRQAPCGLQDILHRLAVVALSNKPVCFYQCFADALERDVIRRTLLEVQAEQCTFRLHCCLVTYSKRHVLLAFCYTTDRNRTLGSKMSAQKRKLWGFRQNDAYAHYSLEAY